MQSTRQYRQKQLSITYQDYVLRGRNLQNLMIEKYVIYNKIGEGAHGEVYRGMDNQSKKQVAIKLMNLKEIYNERNATVKAIKLRLAQSQPKLMYMCDSDYLIKCYDVYSNQDLKLMILEYCNGITLQSQIDQKLRIPQNQAITITKHIINGLMELHKHNIIHRDLKAENIMSHNGKYKIIDFGFSKKLQISQENAEVKGTSLGTITTMAPEVMGKKPYGLKADIWSLGIIFFQMIYGQYPYDSITAQTLYQQIRNKKIFQSEQPLQFNGFRPSKQAFSFIKFLIVFDTEQRPNWKKVIQHPLISKLTDNINQRFIYQVQVSMIPQLINKQILKTQNEGEKSILSQSKQQSSIKQKEKSKGSSLSSESLKQSIDSGIKNQRQLIQSKKSQKSQQQQNVKSSKELQQIRQTEQVKKSGGNNKFNIMQILKQDKMKQQSKLKQQQQLQNKQRRQQQMIRQLKQKQKKQKQQQQYKQKLQKQKKQRQYKQKYGQTPNTSSSIKISKQNQQKFEQLMREQNQRTQFANKSHLQCLKSQLIFQQIILQLQKQKDFKLQSRQNVQLMYLLVTRCFNNMSHLKNQLKMNKELQNLIDNLLHQINPLYNKVNAKFIEYSALLTKFQSKYKQVFKDFFSKTFSKSNYQKKDKFLTGIQVINYTKAEQINYTEECYKNIQQDVYKNVKNRKLIKLLDNYGKIISVKRQDLQISKNTFDGYVKKFL